jgi:hypothetical protein
MWEIWYMKMKTGPRWNRTSDPLVKSQVLYP